MVSLGISSRDVSILLTCDVLLWQVGQQVLVEAKIILKKKKKKSCPLTGVKVKLKKKKKQ